MTANAADMSTPVTRGELREEIEQLELRLDRKLEQRLDERLAPFATKIELEMWGGALLARIEGLEQRFEGLEQRFDGMGQHLKGMEQRLLTEIARHTRAMQEALSVQVSVIDEKYTDLPPRVNRLETAVFTRRKR